MTRGNYRYIQREWTREQLAQATKIKIGTKVEARLCFGEDDERKTHGKKVKGKVTEKYRDHFIVRVRAKSGEEWNESYKYIDLMDGKRVRIC